MGPFEPRPGELREQITLRQWSDVPNSAFGIDQTFDSGINRWAKHEAIHGLTQRAGVQTGEAPTDLFFIRAESGTTPQEITGAHVVEWLGHRYRVMDTISIGATRGFTRITVKDLGAI
jgi:hypothetical protein